MDDVELVSIALGSEATVVLFDGSPFHPQPSALFDMADELGVTLFGVSANTLMHVPRQG